MQEDETVVTPVNGESTENESSEALGTQSTPDAQSSEDTQNTPPEQQSQEDSDALSKRLADLQKERDNLAQERNMLRNKAKELETKRLEETQDYKSAYEQLQSQLEEQEAEKAAERERQEARTFRDKVIATRSDKVQRAAKALIEKNENNLAWRNATDEDDARRQLNDQLDALEAVVGGEQEQTPQEEVYRIDGNNQGGKPSEVPFSSLSLDQMRQVLPRADSRG